MNSIGSGSIPSVDQMKHELEVNIQTPTQQYDHMTHYMMAAATAVGALLSLRYLGNQNLALLSSGIAGTYAASGWYMQQGDRETGYRLGGAASLALLATFTPRLWQSYLKSPLAMDPISNSMVTLGAFHGVHCLLNVGYMNKVRGK